MHPVAARFVTNEVVTNRAGIVPSSFFHLDISTCDSVCVYVWCARGGGREPRTRVYVCAWVRFDNPSDGYCGRRSTEYPALSR